MSAPPGPVWGDDVPLEVIERELVACASQLFAMEARFLGLVAVFDRREGWGGAGLRSCAHWLSWRCGVSLHAARERVRVARALEGLPELSAAFRVGRVSYSKLRAVTRVATAEDERDWLEIAESGTATQVERIAAGCRRAQSEGGESGQAGQNEAGRGQGSGAGEEGESGELRRRFLPDGRVELVAVLAAEDAELVVLALHAATSQSRPTLPSPRSGVGAEASSARPRFAPGSQPSRLAVGLCRLAESFLAHGPASRDGADKYLIAVQVDADVLAEGRDPSPYETGELSVDGRRLSGQVLRRIGCDASVLAMTRHAGCGHVEVGRRRRLVSKRQRRALEARDRGCVFPGCLERRWVDAHHVVHWADGGPTELDNLVLLCRFHHSATHRDGFRISLDRQGVIVRDADGQVIPAAPRLPGVGPQTLDDAEGGDGIDGDVRSWVRLHAVPEPTCRWDGQPLDLNWAVASLCDEAEQRRRSA